MSHLLDKKNILSLMPDFSGELTVLKTTESTNNELLGKKTHQHIVVSEEQTHGRGRRNNVWHSPANKNIYYSLSWRFHKPPAQLQHLSIDVANIVVQVLSDYGVKNLQIKWPNDILANNKKLSGILIDSVSANKGYTDVVIGIGINVELEQEHHDQWTDINSNRNQPADRNVLVGLLSKALLNDLMSIEKGSSTA